MHSYYLLVLLFAICMNLNAYGEDKFFYIPETKLYSLKELALNGDKNAAYKLARYYDF